MLSLGNCQKDSSLVHVDHSPIKRPNTPKAHIKTDTHAKFPNHKHAIGCEDVAASDSETISPVTIFGKRPRDVCDKKKPMQKNEALGLFRLLLLLSSAKPLL